MNVFSFEHPNSNLIGDQNRDRYMCEGYVDVAALQTMSEQRILDK